MLFHDELDKLSLDPGPLLSALEDYRGTIHDLDRRISVGRGSLSVAITDLSSALEHCGMCSGQRAVMAVGNGPSFVASLFAIVSRGGAPLLVHADTPASELGRIAARHGADILVSDNCSCDELTTISHANRYVSSECPWLEVTISRFNSDRAESSIDYPCLTGVPLHPTSGTTGTPKLAVRPGLCAVAEAHNYIRAMDIGQHDYILCTVPMSHAYGYGLGTMVPLVSSADLATMRRFHPKRLARALRDCPVTTLPLVPAMLDLLMLAAPDSLKNGPRRVTSAGAPLSDKTAKRVRELTGTIVRPLYGTTETGVIAIGPEDHELSGGCVGMPLSGVTTRLAPIEGASGVAAGVGRLNIRSSSMMLGYLQATGLDLSVVQGGWFETGDLASIDERSFIQLHGREKETINVFGMKVLPGEIEEVLAMLAQVTDCKVYAGRHRSGSDIVKAAVAAGDGLEVNAIRAHCEKHLAPYKRPEVIHLLKELPRSATGKIIKDRLP